ncbi:MAG: NUDIX hydrolase [Alcaligenaceae bacterium]|nr:NUDIX hydrolase [Alcaligenaceae bacterium]
MPDKALKHPIPAAIAVVIRNAQVLLVRRANPPNQHRWGFPGGKIEIAETIKVAAIRELKEETGVTAEALRVLDAIDVFVPNQKGSIEQHYVLIAVLCRWTMGEALAASDAAEARWFSIEKLDEADPNLLPHVVRIANQALDP